MKTGIVDVGGGLRDIYGWGIFEYCMENEISFDLCIGVSAGSANTSVYLAGQKKRNYPFYTEYPFRKEYMSIKNFLTKKTFLDLDYVYSTLSNSDGENPFDYEAMRRNPADLLVVATNAETAQPVYFAKNDFQQDQYDALKASSAIPFVCKPYSCSGVACFDGALSDSVPVMKAFEEGCDKVVLILTKPLDVPRTPGNDPKFARLIRRKYPKASDALMNRHILYNTQVKKAKELAEEGRVLILSPDNLEGMTTLKRDIEAMEKLYQKGFRDAERLLPGFLNGAT